MTKKVKLLLIPLILILLFLIYCWIIILSTEILATWRHYLGLIFFIMLVVIFFTSVNRATIATGIYLLLASFNFLAITASIHTVGLTFSDSFSTPPIQPLCLVLFVIYFSLNFYFLIDIQLDYKEARSKKRQN